MAKCVIVINGNELSMDELDLMAFGGVVLKLDTEARRRVEASWRIVEQVSSQERAVYGINTGFGELSNVKIAKGDLSKLQQNLIRSHCAGVGAPLAPEIVRRMMCLRINVLAKGYSGISPNNLDRLIAAFNADVLPFVPDKGTVGASGDLAPLSHLALGLMGEGKVWDESKKDFVDAAEHLEAKGLRPIELQSKEGLAMINGVHEARPHSGQIQTAKRLRMLLHPFGQLSELAESHKDCGAVQDAYALRCVPQVHGVAHDTVEFVQSILTREANSATDNPMVFDTGELVSGGNFHGEYPAKACDFLAIAIQELANISERRLERLCNSGSSGLPPFLVEHCGLNSGFMIAHCTSAALVSESRTLCFPASVDTISTSAGKEDHVSMGGWAARKALAVIENVEKVIAIELLAACQALYLLRPLETSPALEEVYRLVRSVAEPLTGDRYMSGDIEAVAHLIKSGQVWDVVKSHLNNPDSQDIRPQVHAQHLKDSTSSSNGTQPVLRLRIKNASEIVCVSRSGELVISGPGTSEKVKRSIIEGPAGVVVAGDGTILAVGPESEIEAAFFDSTFEEVVDASGKSVIPGLVDCHSHPIWAGDRTGEFAMKMEGKSYMEIHKAGGGINFTVEETRKASEDELLELLKARLHRMLRHGTTTCEIKSGYGLNAETELKMLKTAEAASKVQPIEIVSTALLGHAIPAGSNTKEALEDILDNQLPEILCLQKQGELKCLRLIDIFCEKGIFEVEDSKKVLLAGMEAGMLANFHGDELAPLGSGVMAGQIGAVAMSHCEETDSNGIQAMKEAGTIAVLLPTTQQVLQLKSPPVRDFINASVPIALASDFNPNCHILSLPLVMWQACTSWRIGIEESLAAVTLNAAASLGKSQTHGSIEPGKSGDMLILNSASWQKLVYEFGSDHEVIGSVIKNGYVVHSS